MGVASPRVEHTGTVPAEEADAQDRREEKLGKNLDALHMRCAEAHASGRSKSRSGTEPLAFEKARAGGTSCILLP